CGHGRCAGAGRCGQPVLVNRGDACITAGPREAWRSVELGAPQRNAAAVGVSADDKDMAVLEERGRVERARRYQGAGRRPRPACRIVELGVSEDDAGAGVSACEKDLTALEQRAVAVIATA